MTRFKGRKVYARSEMERVRTLYQAAEGRLLRKPARQWLRIRWDRVTRLWQLIADRVPVGAYRTKAEAISAGRAWCRAREPSQLIIRDKIGRIIDEHTYGAV